MSASGKRAQDTVAAPQTAAALRNYRRFIRTTLRLLFELRYCAGRGVDPDIHRSLKIFDQHLMFERADGSAKYCDRSGGKIVVRALSTLER